MKVLLFLKQLRTIIKSRFNSLVIVLIVLLVISGGVTIFASRKTLFINKKFIILEEEKLELQKNFTKSEEEYQKLAEQDQILRNEKLQGEIKEIHDSYLKGVSAYQNLLDLKISSNKTQKLDELFASGLKLLADKNYSSASSTFDKLDIQIKEEKIKLTPTAKPTTSIPVNNSPPVGGYSRQKVRIDNGEFLVDIISADLSSTKVIVDTASEGDCTDNCPVLSLGDYVARNGAFAGVNGSYFCPSTYPDCANKKNSFDTLLMNKNKKYFNSDNNVYSVISAVIFLGNTVRFVEKSQDLGRDTGIDGMIANFPLLVLNNAIYFSGDNVAKHNNKGGRSFVGATGSTVYIGVVHSATVVESAKILHALGIQNALNLDDGGSTALWYSGYKTGPGRNIPNAILFVKK